MEVEGFLWEIPYLTQEPQQLEIAVIDLQLWRARKAAQAIRECM
jgi:hypothetical protein